MFQYRDPSTIYFKDAECIVLVKGNPPSFFKNLNLNRTYILFNPFIKNFTQESAEFFRWNLIAGDFSNRARQTFYQW